MKTWEFILFIIFMTIRESIVFHGIHESPHFSMEKTKIKNTNGKHRIESYSVAIWELIVFNET